MRNCVACCISLSQDRVPWPAIFLRAFVCSVAFLLSSLTPSLSFSDARKAAEKYDPKMETEAKEWLETLTGTTMSGKFSDWLKDGTILCQ